MKSVQNVMIDESQIAVNPLYKQHLVDDSEFEMILFKGRCKECDEEICMYDFDGKRAYFRNVVPNFIG